MLARLPSGVPSRLGAHAVEDGITFAVWSREATAVELCVFDGTGREHRHGLERSSEGIWHGFLDGAGPGLRYGYRAHGEWDPEQGLRFNPAKLLIDPWARRVDGRLIWHEALFDHRRDAAPAWIPDGRDSAAFVPRSVVMSDRPTEDRPQRPRIAWGDTLIQEINVRGLTMRHPEVPRTLRGCFAALAHPALIAHWQRLGITTLEWMPVQTWIDEEAVVRRGQANAWGYNPIGYSAPMARLVAGPDPLAEIRTTVDALHRAGIEVLLDLVYNHSAEGDARGPTLSMRGFGERDWYRLDPDDPTRHRDSSGCGNTLDLSRPAVFAWFVDSLAWWYQDIGVDGFRLDLASALTRDTADQPDPTAFVAALIADPRLASAKLVVEPWDARHDGYCGGRFPAPAVEWNDRYRDDVRRWWGGLDGGPASLATRLAGSSDRFGAERGPLASLNYLAAHDGFTLADVVAYARRHNDGNGENGADGPPHEPSWNHGVEGATADPAVLDLRLRQVHAMLATLFVSQGVPMLQAGDELGRTQHGNNNAYCHDDTLGWIDWQPHAPGRARCRLIERLARLRREYPSLRRSRFLTGTGATGCWPDVEWLAPDGQMFATDDWHRPGQRAFAMWLADDRAGGALAVLLNGSASAVDFLWPSHRACASARRLLDSADPFADIVEASVHTPVRVEPYALVVIAVRRAAE
jgi:glycogen operon protein